jgi:hypothetical protein
MSFCRLHSSSVSRAVALRNEPTWNAEMSRLPLYLDPDGMLRYFPVETQAGSDVLTAYVLAVANEAGYAIPDDLRARMIEALKGFVAGRVQRDSVWPAPDLSVRKLAAIEAVSRYGAAESSMLTSIALEPNLWPTSAVLDWTAVLRHLTDVPRRAARLDEARQIVRSRLNFQGTQMGFSTERNDALWWLMVSGDVNAARAVLALLDVPAWRDDLPRMMRGLLGRQRRGHWDTTANAWACSLRPSSAPRSRKTPCRPPSPRSTDRPRGRVTRERPRRRRVPVASGPGTPTLAHEGAGHLAFVEPRSAAAHGTGVHRLRDPPNVTPIEQSLRASGHAATSRGSASRSTRSPTWVGWW